IRDRNVTGVQTCALPIYLGFSLAKRGRYREALPYYKEAVETVDFLYSQTRGYSEETRATFLQQFSAIYRETIRVLLQLHRSHPRSEERRVGKECTSGWWT